MFWRRKSAVAGSAPHTEGKRIYLIDLILRIAPRCGMAPPRTARLRRTYTICTFFVALLGLSSALRLLVVVHSYRDSDRTIRLISARKATHSERAQYNAQFRS